MRARERRLDALEARGGREPVALLVVATWAELEPVGIGAVPGRLPEVARLPGESWDACVKRAGALARGPGPLLAFALYAQG